MSKREKIIILVMLLAIVYGALNYILSGDDKGSIFKTEKRKESLNKLVTDVAQNITENAMFQLDNYIVQQASTPWEQNPFYVPPENKAVEISQEEMQAIAQKEIVEANLNYAGYIQIGPTTLAIINGTEYEAGESLDTPGYRVKAIYPQKVLITKESDAQELIIPLEGTQHAGTSPEEPSDNL